MLCACYVPMCYSRTNRHKIMCLLCAIPTNNKDIAVWHTKTIKRHDFFAIMLMYNSARSQLCNMGRQKNIIMNKKIIFKKVEKINIYSVEILMETGWKWLYILYISYIHFLSSPFAKGSVFSPLYIHFIVCNRIYTYIYKLLLLFFFFLIITK